MLLKSLLVLTLHYAGGLAMRVPDNIYITSRPSLDGQHATQRDLETDLVAPAASSLSQYYQEQNYPTLGYFHQLAQQNPFLYKGPLIMMVAPDFGQSEKKHLERLSQDHEKSSYSLYRPTPEDNPQFVDMLPPPAVQDEPNYYAVKPRKNKKYSAIDDKQKKYLKVKESEDLKSKIDHVEKSDELDQPISQETTSSPLNSEEISTKLKNGTENSRQERDTVDEAKSEEELKDESDSIETSAPSSRLDFQMHGHRGPKSYKFGYDTGKGPNRQFKVEEKDEHGNVLGQYGYYDDKGKLRVVKYSSMANDGFKILL